jgi:hypothetical protein
MLGAKNKRANASRCSSPGDSTEALQTSVVYQLHVKPYYFTFGTPKHMLADFILLKKSKDKVACMRPSLEHALKAVI